MLTSELHYELPPERIAPSPSEKRDESRLLVHDRASGKTTHHRFRDLPDLLPVGTRIFRNDVSVLKARLPGQRPGGGKVECLLLRPEQPSEGIWRCLLKPGGKVAKAGAFSLPGEYEATVQEVLPTGEYLVRFLLTRDPDVPALARRIGSMPLPHYLKRPADSSDEQRYQTVYADPAKRTAAAAPTAGLHFTPELLEQLESCSSLPSNYVWIVERMNKRRPGPFQHGFGRGDSSFKSRFAEGDFRIVADHSLHLDFWCGVRHHDVCRHAYSLCC